MGCIYQGFVVPLPANVHGEKRSLFIFSEGFPATVRDDIPERVLEYFHSFRVGAHFLPRPLQDLYPAAEDDVGPS